MNDDAKENDWPLPNLYSVALLCDKRGHERSAAVCRAGAMRIERLEAENAALRAEAERLTPLADAMDTVDAMNKHKVNGMTWRIGTPSLVGNGVNGINGTPESACYSLAAGKHRVHQIEDRDAGPIAAREPAKGEDE